jgi:signal transduction histidine kinase
LDFNNKTIIIPVVLVSSILLGLLSYSHFTQTENQIQQLAIDDLQTNAEIEAYSISNSLANAISAITSNLELIANSPSTIDGNASAVQTMLEIGQESTRNLTDGYYFLDSEGKFTSFTGIEKEENARYRDIDLSYRDYFQIPKQNGTLYTSTVIDSNDNVSRLYISVPIITTVTGDENDQLGLIQTVEEEGLATQSTNRNETSFNGVVVASIEAKTLGNFLEEQVHPKFGGGVGFIDRDGAIIYSQNQTFIGKNYFGEEFQSYLKSVLKDREEGFNKIINKSLNSESGLDEFNFENTSTTIAYEAVTGPSINNNDEHQNRIGTLFITIPHTLAADVGSLIDNQKITNFLTIVLIAAIVTALVILLLRWNKILAEQVTQKTSQLRETVDKLRITNEELKNHDKMQKEFINIAAHELRTPTQAISGNLELIEMIHLPSLFEKPSKEVQNAVDEELEYLIRDKDKSHEFISGLVSTYRNSQRLEKLVNNILDVSRIESNRLELHLESFNLNEKIKNVIKDVHSKINLNSEKGRPVNQVDIIFEPKDDPINVFADKIKIFEVISNLIDNAMKFSNGQSITISSQKFQKSEIRMHFDQHHHHHSKESSIVKTENTRSSGGRGPRRRPCRR